MTPKLNSSFFCKPFFILFKIIYFISVSNQIIQKIGGNSFFKKKLIIFKVVSRFASFQVHGDNICNRMHFSILYIKASMWRNFFIFVISIFLIHYLGYYLGFIVIFFFNFLFCFYNKVIDFNE